MGALIERRIEGDKITCLFKSVNILQSEYYASKMLLEVTFRNGFKYRYHAVTSMEHAGMQIADSAGQYLYKHFRNKRYDKLGVVPINEILERIGKSRL
jgi:hypothetical protein